MYNISMRQRYSADEALNRILRSIQGLSVGSENPGTLTGEILSVNQALSDLAELLEGSLPNFSGTVPANITRHNYLLKKPCGVFAYLSTGTATTCETADQWYPILGPFVNSPFEDFTIQDDMITYIGGIDQNFEIDWHCTVSADAANTTSYITIKHNDEVHAAQKMGTLMKNAGQAYAYSGTLVHTISPDDTIQLVIQADGDGDVLTVHHFTTTIRQFFY